MVADTSDCCSLEFAERDWVSNDNESSNLKPRFRFISTRRRSKMFIKNVGAEVVMIEELMLLFFMTERGLW